jgi:hypothetical protein
MAFVYSCPACGKVLGTDTDPVAKPVCSCGQRFDPLGLRDLRRRDRLLHVVFAAGCFSVLGGMGGALAADSLGREPVPGMLAGWLAAFILGFLAFAKYDAWRNN